MYILKAEFGKRRTWDLVGSETAVWFCFYLVSMGWHEANEIGINDQQEVGVVFYVISLHSCARGMEGSLLDWLPVIYQVSFNGLYSTVNVRHRSEPW